MRTRIVRIGNSQGVRIPRPLLQQAGLDNQVEIVVRGGSLVIRPAQDKRAGWGDAFARATRTKEPESATRGRRADHEGWMWE